MTDQATPSAAKRGLMSRLNDAGTPDAEERAQERHHRIALATVAGIASRALTALTLLVALPLASSRLAPEELGVWTLLVTAVALLGFADLGLSNGLLNVLSDSLGKDDPRTAREAVASAAVGLCLLAVVGAAVAIILVPSLPWSRFLRVDPNQVPDLDLAIGLFAGIVLFTIPAGIGQRIHFAYQQGWAAAATSGIGSLLALAAVLAVAASDGSLPWFVAAMLGPPALSYAAESVWVFGRSHRDIRPRHHDIDLVVLRRLVRSGFLFFVLGVAGAAAYQSDTLVIAHYLGAAEVTRYGVSLRLFTVVPSALTALLMPLWPAYGEALARQDHQWVRATIRRSLLVSVGVSAGASMVLLLITRPLLSAWSPHVALPSSSLLLALAGWAVVSSCSVALSMYFNGASVIRFQVVLAMLMAPTNLALSIALVIPLGAAGPVWASVVTQTVVVLIPQLVVIRPLVRRDSHPIPVPAAASR